jgi:hypothetical protein
MLYFFVRHSKARTHQSRQQLGTNTKYLLFVLGGNWEDKEKEKREEERGSFSISSLQFLLFFFEQGFPFPLFLFFSFFLFFFFPFTLPALSLFLPHLLSAINNKGFPNSVSGAI